MPNLNKIALAVAGAALFTSACVPEVLVDTQKPTLAQVTAVPSPTNDTTPNYTFSSSEAGTITYGGSCTSAKTKAVKGNNAITFNTLAAGTYSDCTIAVKDAAKNISSVLSVTAFTVDTTPPTLSEITAVPYGKDTTPDYTFSSSEAGIIGYGGDCSSATTSASSGNNSITFAVLGYGNHDNCTVMVIDAAGNASTALAISRFAVAMKPYNDTGITLCGDYADPYTTHNNDVDCFTGTGVPATATEQFAMELANGNNPVPGGQDAIFGRDANPATNSDADGHKGFSFTKLKSDGTALADQTQTWSDTGSEGAGTKWSCVQDNLTGLIWEVKTNNVTPDLHDQDWTYSWYNSTGVNDGGTGGYSDDADNCFTTTRCDTEKYVADVNSATLCGSNDWRLPKKEELQTIIARYRYNPTIDEAFIPNTVSNYYWSSSPAVVVTTFDQAWFMSFGSGSSVMSLKNTGGRVRLVRGSR